MVRERALPDPNRLTDAERRVIEDEAQEYQAWVQRNRVLALQEQVRALTRRVEELEARHG